MIFGKRRAATVSAEPMAPSTQQKIIPDEIWQSDLGKSLRAAGLSPDDESNLVPTAETVDARIARDRAAFEAKLRQMNDEIHARTNGGHVQPFYLIPEPCWNGETGHFLTMRLGMSPYEDWNIAYLPPDERFTKILGLPRHPNEEALLFVKDVDEFLHAKMAQMDEITREADRTHEFARFKKRQDDLKEVIHSFAGWLLEQYTKLWEEHAAARSRT